MTVHEDNIVVLPLQCVTNGYERSHNGVNYYHLGDLLYQGEHWMVFCCHYTIFLSLTPMLTNIKIDEENRVLYFTDQIRNSSGLPMLTHMVMREAHRGSSDLSIMNLDSRRSWSDPLTIESNTIVATVENTSMISRTCSTLKRPVVVIDGFGVQRDTSQKYTSRLFKSGHARIINVGKMEKPIPIIHCRIEGQTTNPNPIMDIQVGVIYHAHEWRNSAVRLHMPSSLDRGGKNWTQYTGEITHDLW